MSRINKLSKQVANQIAAGEVVERPASVVKEILENAIDARATNLKIEIEQGGLALCRIRDDGEGIVKADLKLAVSPHATSKIAQVEDLFTLDSLGFRGEALASISSVSRFSIRSKVASQDSAWQLSVNEHGVGQPTPTAHPQGTTITVEDLFYNVPVRRKFLKSPRTEFSHIEEVVKKIALSHFAVGIMLKHNSKIIFNLPPAFTEQEMALRVEQLFGKAFIDNSQYFEESQSSYSLSGWLCSPEYLRSQNDLQVIFLNGRMIKDKLLIHAIRQVYDPYLYPGRSACFLLYFSLPIELVDVNVHPTKHEVRFRDGRDIHDFFVSVLRRQLGALLHQDEYVAPEQVYAKQTNKPHTPTDQSLRLQSKSVNHSMAVDAELSKSPIIAISTYYCMILTSDESYLFDVNKVYQYWLIARLKKAMTVDSKLASRPLLVPITIELTEEKLNQMVMNEYEKYGLEISQLATNTICVRTMPIMTPHLDIKLCIESLSSLKDPNFIESIVQSSGITFSLLSEEEKASLARFILEYEGDSLPCKILTDQQWGEIVNE